jgi:hypothetical protein
MEGVQNPNKKMKDYMIKFVSDLGQVGGFLQFPPLIKLTTII